MLLPPFAEGLSVAETRSSRSGGPGGAFSSGGGVSQQHYMWRTFTNDMFMDDGSSYAYATTEDGTGATISFTYPDGIISWMTRQSKETQTPAGTQKSFL